MFQIVKKEMQWGGRTLTLETGRIARQADGAVLVTYGDTVVLCTATAARAPKPGVDFFPLTVHYQEKTFAAGKIPGGFFKREGKPSEKEVLTSRLIDRPIRPMFADGFYNETQIICTLLSHDLENDPDIIALIGASAALTLSGVPFLGPIGACRVAYINNEFVLNPTKAQMEETTLDLVVAGTESSVLMVESEAKELSEEVMLSAVTFGHQAFQPVLDLIISLAEEAAKEPWELAPKAYTDAQVAELRALVEADLRAAYKIIAKQERSNALAVAKAKALEALVNETTSELIVTKMFKALEQDIVRNGLIESGQRIDGRAVDKVRPILAEVNVLPRTHGSALFTRGETQALAVATLGTSQDEQLIDSLEGSYYENFMLHYNFPPYSVGEASPMRPPGRREVGHGKLAWRSLRAVLPTKEEFPYTLRLVSEITESNGSSSMATVCGSSLAMMDAGVPLKRPVAGIAMGLIKEGDKFVVLSDIMGDEDHLGDMDFKVAGTDQGITALQMDIKINGITQEIMKIALHQAHDGRHHILGEMAKALTSARQELNANAPRITSFQINKDKIREVIGSGGKVIREIVEKTGAKVDIEDDGTIKIFSTSEEQGKAAEEWIRSIADDPEVGRIYEGKVVKIMDFGAFVNFMGARDGLVHISEIVEERLNAVGDVLSEGQDVKVKLLDVDPRGKCRLSMRLVDQATGADLTEERGLREQPAREGGRDGGRGGDRGDRGPRRDKRANG
jgi:polyribonucleotide nucleotidyltransferase